MSQARPGSLVYKGQPVSLVCNLKDEGRPPADQYVWYKVGRGVTATVRADIIIFTAGWS